MGFLSNMADEAGKKTGKAIGNKLFGRYADDVRIGYGEIGDNGAASAKAEVKKTKIEAKERRKDLKLQEKFNVKNNLRQQINEIQSIAFDTQNVKANINALMQLSSIIESINEDELGSSWDEEENTLQQKLLDSAQSKLMMGINLCKAIDPTDSTIAMFENMINERQQVKEEKKREEKKKDKLVIWIGIGSFILFILFAIILGLCQ